MDLLKQSGLVTLYDYKQVENLEIYKALQRSSERFLVTHEKVLKNYSRGSVADPFHQWSRRWEYPWVASRLPRTGPVKILDAGSGLTFFPFYLAEQNPSAEIHCLDSDPKLEAHFAAIAAPRVKFTHGSFGS